MRLKLMVLTVAVILLWTGTIYAGEFNIQKNQRLSNVNCNMAEYDDGSIWQGRNVRLLENDDFYFSPCGEELNGSGNAFWRLFNVSFGGSFIHTHNAKVNSRHEHAIKIDFPTVGRVGLGFKITF